jgi:ferredoxin-NADP reductase
VDGAVEPGAAMALQVTQVRLEASGVISVTLARPDGADLPAWEPGAHLELRLPSGLVRQYSLCGDPEDRRRYTVAVLREEAGRGGSKEMHDVGLVGRSLAVKGPRNNFRLLGHPRYVFIAGGIGITPILAMVRAVARTAASWRLAYGGRSRGSMAFAEELTRLGGDRVSLVPQDEMGLLDIDAIVSAADAETGIYCCGPQPLLEAVESARARLAPDTNLYVERFAAKKSAATPAVAASALDDAEFELELRRSGITVVVPADRSALDVMRDHLPDMDYSCEEGYCGSCESRVLEGVPEHRDDILTEEERQAGATMFPCVSRARTRRLVLDR